MSRRITEKHIFYYYSCETIYSQFEACEQCFYWTHWIISATAVAVVVFAVVCKTCLIFWPIIYIRMMSFVWFYNLWSSINFKTHQMFKASNQKLIVLIVTMAFNKRVFFSSSFLSFFCDCCVSVRAHAVIIISRGFRSKFALYMGLLFNCRRRRFGFCFYYQNSSCR